NHRPAALALLARQPDGHAARSPRHQRLVVTPAVADSRHGEENLPASGAAILAANHVGVLDGPLLVAMTRRTTFALAKSSLFTGRVGWALQAVGQIPV